MVIDIVCKKAGAYPALQSCARQLLTTCWSLLLPTPKERAITLLSLIDSPDISETSSHPHQHSHHYQQPQSQQMRPQSSNSGSFMIGLLVESLLADRDLLSVLSMRWQEPLQAEEEATAPVTQFISRLLR